MPNTPYPLLPFVQGGRPGGYPVPGRDVRPPAAAIPPRLEDLSTAELEEIALKNPEAARIVAQRAQDAVGSPGENEKTAKAWENFQQATKGPNLPAGWVDPQNPTVLDALPMGWPSQPPATTGLNQPTAVADNGPWYQGIGSGLREGVEGVGDSIADYIGRIGPEAKQMFAEMMPGGPNQSAAQVSQPMPQPGFSAGMDGPPPVVPPQVAAPQAAPQVAMPPGMEQMNMDQEAGYRPGVPTAPAAPADGGGLFGTDMFTKDEHYDNLLRFGLSLMKAGNKPVQPGQNMFGATLGNLGEAGLDTLNYTDKKKLREVAAAWDKEKFGKTLAQGDRKIKSTEELAKAKDRNTAYWRRAQAATSGETLNLKRAEAANDAFNEWKESPEGIQALNDPKVMKAKKAEFDRMFDVSKSSEKKSGGKTLSADQTREINKVLADVRSGKIKDKATAQRRIDQIKSWSK